MLYLFDLLVRPQTLVYLAVGALLALVTVVLPVAGAFDVPAVERTGTVSVEGTVLRVAEVDRLRTERGTVVTEQVDVAIEDGRGIAVPAGGVAAVERSRLEGTAAGLDLRPGERVLLDVAETPDGTRYFISDRVRRFPLWTLAVAFGALVLAIGRWGGAWSLFGLAASLLVVVRFIVPAILDGADPLLVSVAGALVVMSTTLVLSHGVSWKTGAALAGTAVSLVLTALLAMLSIGFAQLSGIATDEAATLQVLSLGEIDARGLLLGGIIIGALGVLDDVTTTQASAVFELRRANSDLGAGELYRRAMNVGSDHIAATVNTLVLAYAGAALPLLIILAIQPEPLGMLVNRDLIATEIVRTLVGSIGIVAAVPITTALAALAAPRLAAPPPAQMRAARTRGGEG